MSRVLLCVVLLAPLAACDAPTRTIAPVTTAATTTTAAAATAAATTAATATPSVVATFSSATTTAVAATTAVTAASTAAATATPASGVEVPPTATEISYVSAMIEHHRQALRMVGELRGRAGVPYRISNLAERITAVQSAEIADMAEFLTAWRKAPWHVHDMPMPRPSGAAEGTDAGGNFLRMMIVHHEIAVEMSAVMLPEAENPWVISLARHVIADQRVELASMRRILDEARP